MIRISISAAVAILLTANLVLAQRTTGILTYEYESHADGDIAFSDWHTISVGLQRTISGTTLVGEALHTRRFGTDDAAMAAAVYRTLWSGADAALHLQLAPGADVLPPLSFAAELNQAVGAGFVAGGSYRLIDAGSENVHLRGAALAKYLGRWYLQGRAFQVAAGDESSAALAAIARRYLGDEGFIQISGGRGREAVLLGVGPRIELRRTRSVAAHADIFLSRRWGSRLTATANEMEGLPTRRGIAGGLLLRW